MTKLKLDQIQLRELLDYDPASGLFIWKFSRRGVSKGGIAGRVINSTGEHKYIVINIYHVTYRAHRLAVLWMTGKWPEVLVDHKDRNGLNNSWKNLRCATQTQNRGNSKRSSHNTTGLKGTHFHKKARKFSASIWMNGKSNHLGLFETAEQAHEAYLAAASIYFGEFARAA